MVIPHLPPQARLRVQTEHIMYVGWAGGQEHDSTTAPPEAIRDVHARMQDKAITDDGTPWLQSAQQKWTHADACTQALATDLP
jgi:hypothetical protein